MLWLAAAFAFKCLIIGGLRVKSTCGWGYGLKAKDAGSVLPGVQPSGVDLYFKCIELGGVIMPALEKIYCQC
jgi:hypothetical protein